MRHILGSLTAVAGVLVLAGCGSTSSASMAPASDPAGNPSRSPGPIAGAHVLPLVSLPGGGGRASATATSLASQTDLGRFVAQFRVPALRHRIIRAAAAAHVPDGSQLMGEVVAVGCDRPPSADAVVDPHGHVQLMPHLVASPMAECRTQVTTVALAVIPPAG